MLFEMAMSEETLKFQEVPLLETPVSWKLSGIIFMFLLVGIALFSIIRKRQSPRQQLQRLLHLPPSMDNLEKIVCILKLLHAPESLLHELDMLRFAPDTPNPEQLAQVFDKIRHAL